MIQLIAGVQKCVFVLAVLAAGSLANAQKPAPPLLLPKPSTIPGPAPAMRATQASEAAVKLGERSREAQKKAAIIPVLVIVSNAPSYVQAISAWTPEARFPVLIDDGSVLAADNIGRFARAFAPKQIVQFSAGKSVGGWIANKADVEAAFAKASAAESVQIDSLRSAWEKRSHQPAGVVVTNENDPAWTAALALAAGRGQPLLWFTDAQASRNLHEVWNADAANAFDKLLQDECAKLGYSWSDLGDTIDSVTICASTPNGFEIAPREMRATTDRVGRLRADAPGRWAWCGQIFGNPAEAAYRAMCPLFLENNKAWFFDTYPRTSPWSNYSLAQTKAALSKDFQAELFETPGANAILWREQTARPIDAGLVFVNTKGNSDFFELENGYGYCGDVPMLLRPAAVHIIHSWSMQYPGARNTIGGRWLERGAYLYYGSINEPTLAAFTPCPQVGELLAKSAAFGGTVRRDQGGIWKLTVIGDPLATVTPGAIGTRVETALPLADVKVVSTEAGELVRKGDFAGAIRAFALEGNDETAAKLASALLKDRPSAVTPAVARNAIPSLMRMGRNQDVVAAFRAAKIQSDDKSNDTGFLRDCLWTASSNTLRSRSATADAMLLDTLRDNIRPEQLDQDLIAMGIAWARAVDFATSIGIVEQIAGQQTEPYLKKKGARAIEELRKNRR